MIQLFVIALQNLIQHTKRTLLLGGAISGVTAVLVFMVSLSAGIHRTMLESATTLSTGHLNVGGFYKVTAGQSAPVVTQYQKVMDIVKNTVPDLDFVAARGRGWAKLISDTASQQAAIGGIDVKNEPGFRKVIHMESGNLDDLAQPRTILLFHDQAKKLDVRVGDTVVLSSQTTRGINNTLDVRVIGIAQDIGVLSQWNVYISDVSLRELYQFNPDTTGAVHIYLKDIKNIPRDMDLLRKALADRGYILMDREAKPFWQKFESVNREDWTGQKLDLTTWEEEMTFFSWMIAGVDGLMFILIAILLVIISIGIMNSMWIAIRERTREIGTLRAIGMQRPRVLFMFLIEAFSLGFIGTTAGVVIGICVSSLLNAAHIRVPEGARFFLMSSTLKVSFDLPHVLAGMAIIIACTTLIAIIPSIHAARLKPITAMQHLG